MCHCDTQICGWFCTNAVITSGWSSRPFTSTVRSIGAICLDRIKQADKAVHPNVLYKCSHTAIDPGVIKSLRWSGSVIFRCTATATAVTEDRGVAHPNQTPQWVLWPPLHNRWLPPSTCFADSSPRVHITHSLPSDTSDSLCVTLLTMSHSPA